MKSIFKRFFKFLLKNKTGPVCMLFLIFMFLAPPIAEASMYEDNMANWASQNGYEDDYGSSIYTISDTFHDNPQSWIRAYASANFAGMNNWSDVAYWDCFMNQSSGSESRGAADSDYYYTKTWREMTIGGVICWVIHATTQTSSYTSEREYIACPHPGPPLSSSNRGDYFFWGSSQNQSISVTGYASSFMTWLKQNSGTQDSDGDGVNDDIDKCPNTIAGTTVDADGCPIALTMIITVTTDKTAYGPGDTALISGNVSDSKGALAGAAVSVDVSGTILSATTDASGNYHVSFSIPADVGLVSYPTTATATHAGYPSVSASTIFSIQDTLTVEVSADADHYLIGDTVYFTIIVKDSKGIGVSLAGLDITATRLGSGSTTTLAAITDGLGENVWSFIWGQDDSGNTIAEGKLQIDVIASKDGYIDGSASKTLSGCGDLEKSDIEDCLDCPEDCTCTDNEICDPSSNHKNSETFCSPKMAYVFISRGLGWYDEWWASDDIKQIRRFYKSLGYTVPSNIYVDHINQIAKYLSRPSTKAIAYAGHGEDPGGTPTIEAAAATSGGYPVKTAIDTMSKNPGGFLYTCQFETYAAKWVDSKDKIEKIAQAQVDHPNLEYAYIFSCYSLDDTSLRDYLLKSGGTYWGYKGKLPGDATLTKSIKP